MGLLDSNFHCCVRARPRKAHREVLNERRSCCVSSLEAWSSALTSIHGSVNDCAFARSRRAQQPRRRSAHDATREPKASGSVTQRPSIYSGVRLQRNRHGATGAWQRRQEIFFVSNGVERQTKPKNPGDAWRPWRRGGSKRLAPHRAVSW
jgi:hypothetical protein